ncbi:dimethylargininase [Conyzicola lurida]|uniref:Dimethylargininase n=1 Tax=Conyzicola lurida TaxID=1172621 RepID=A0A841AHT5_9MICO|nr:dimethylargininase [Conyzicola lurida]MBB5841908.1 dimethylargininase [Conyzicola lurida]
MPFSLTRRLVASVLTALALSLTAHVAAVVAFSIANSFAADSLAQMNAYFLPASLISFVITFLFAALGSFRLWYTALGAGIVTGVVSGMIGSLVGASAAGATLTPDILGPLFGTITTINLVFFLTTAITAPTLARRVWLLVLDAPASARDGAAHYALVRQPSTNLADGVVTHIERVQIDTDLADEQWDNYVSVLDAHGFTTVEVDPAPELADAVFIEDAVIVFGDLAVIASPGSEHRRDEIVGAEAAVVGLGLEVTRIELPGTLDGGDVLKVGSTVYVGRGGRTNGEGIRQLRAILTPRGYDVVAVPVTKVLHLKSAVTALPDGTVIGYPPLVDDPAIFDRFLAVPEEGGAHVVVLSADTVLMAASAPQSAALIGNLGYRVVTVDISEFEKLEGCVTCLSVRVR